jgi:hypothetical protein
MAEKNLQGRGVCIGYEFGALPSMVVITLRDPLEKDRHLLALPTHSLLRIEEGGSESRTADVGPDPTSWAPVLVVVCTFAVVVVVVVVVLAQGGEGQPSHRKFRPLR